MNKNTKKDYDDVDYEIEEVAEKFGSSFSDMTSKVMKNSNSRKKKDFKFRKDGFYDGRK